MKLAFTDITPEPSLVTVTDTARLETGWLGVDSPVVATMSVYLVSEDTAALEGELSGKLVIGCSRCGEAVPYHLDERFYYRLTLQPEVITEDGDRECSDEECETLYLREPVVDFEEIFREQCCLAVPEKVLCREDCPGLCMNCGESLAKNACSCTDQNPDSPFAVLKKLKND